MVLTKQEEVFFHSSLGDGDIPAKYWIKISKINDPQTMNAFPLWKHNNCKSLWFNSLSGSKKKCCHAVLQPRNLPHLGGYCHTQQLLLFGDRIWQSEWTPLCLAHLVCAWNISIDIVPDVSFWIELLSWTKVVMLKTAELLFWVKRPYTLLVAVVVSKMPWGGNISFCVWRMKSMDLGCVQLGIKEACPTCSYWMWNVFSS